MKFPQPAQATRKEICKCNTSSTRKHKITPNDCSYWLAQVTIPATEYYMPHSKQYEQHTQHKQQAAEASAQGIQAQHTKGTGQTDLMAPVYSTTHKAPSYLNLR